MDGLEFCHTRGYGGWTDDLACEGFGGWTDIMGCGGWTDDLACERVMVDGLTLWLARGWIQG